MIRDGKFLLKSFISANEIKYEDHLINFRLKIYDLEHQLNVMKRQQRMKAVLEKYDRKRGQHQILLTQLFGEHKKKIFKYKILNNAGHL